MLSATADYALRAVLFLGRKHDGSVVPADEIADAIGAPRNYLSKTLHALTKAGIAVSTPGRYGGFALAAPPHRITLEQVVRVFDEGAKPSRCLLGDRPCDPKSPCTAHRRWVAISQTQRSALSSTTVADLLESD